MSESIEEKYLRKLVNISSVFPNEKEVLETLEEELINLGFSIERHNVTDNRWSILAERGSGSASVLFYGHVDTVPEYGGWSTNPTRLTTKGDKLYGLGACDMKGGIASLLSALKNDNSKSHIKVLFSVDEENLSVGAWSVVNERKEWFKDIKLIVVGEPGASATQTGGVDVLTLGRRGRAVYEIEVFGKSAHGAHPEKGVNALTEASRIVLELEKLKLPKDKYLGDATLFVRNIRSDTSGLSIPNRAVIEVDRHIVKPETIKSAKKQLDEFISNLYKAGKISNDSDRKVKVSVKKRETSYTSWYITDKSNKYVKEIIGFVENDLGKKVVFNYGRSIADDNIFSNILKKPVVTIGPMGENIHAANEWVSAKSMKEVADLYGMIIASNTK